MICLKLIYSPEVGFFHDPLEIDVLFGGKVVFSAHLESVFLVEPDGATAFVEGAIVDFADVARLELDEGPRHELVAEALVEKFTKHIDLPDFESIRLRGP